MENSQNKMTKDMLEHILRPARRLVGVPQYASHLPSSIDMIPANAIAKCTEVIKGQEGTTLELSTTVIIPLSL